MANEKRLDLIDRQAFIDDIKTEIVNLRLDGLKGTPRFCDELSALIDRIEEQPGVDAVEVVHGHWISLTECANAGVYCSVCNKKVYKEDYAWCNRKNKLRSNYCPNCGAKMDGDGNG